MGYEVLQGRDVIYIHTKKKNNSPSLLCDVKFHKYLHVLSILMFRTCIKHVTLKRVNPSKINLSHFFSLDRRKSSNGFLINREINSHVALVASHANERFSDLYKK